MLITQQSLAPLTAFAPYWQLHFWHSRWTNTAAIQERKNPCSLKSFELDSIITVAQAYQQTP
jgi:hypothetical protein